jgi:Fe-S-cluster containining protein
MRMLAGSDRLPLTCTREGVCCHGHSIWVNPWEVARLAQGRELTVPEFSAQFLDCRGTRLRFDGPPDHRGKPGCRLYSPTAGCTQHPDRPLTCRTYPLGRSRLEGAVGYYHVDAGLPCRELCPSVVDLPEQSVADYLAGQDIVAGETAHDAYARVIYGLVAVAASICRLGGEAVDRARVDGFLAQCRIQTPEARSNLLPDDWMALATAPQGLDLTSPAAFAAAHGQRMTAVVQRAAAQIDNGLTDAAVLYVALAVHLAPTVGADLQAMAGMLAETDGPAPEHIEI